MGHCCGISGGFSDQLLWYSAVSCSAASATVKSEWNGKRELSGLLHTGVESCQAIICCQSRHLQSLLIPPALLGGSSKFPFHTEGQERQESLCGTQSVINIPPFPTPSKGVSTSQFLTISACTQVSLWKRLHKQHTLPSAPKGSLQSRT